MKKLLALLLALCMVFALAACGSAPAPAAPAEEPAPAEAETDAYFDAEAAFEPAPAGSIPELTLDPAPIDFTPESDAQESGNEQ